MLGRGVKFLFVEQDIVSVEDHVLHHDILVAFELGIRRQTRGIDRHHLLPVHSDAGGLVALRPCLRCAPLPFRGVVLGRRLWCVGLDRGHALLALEPVDLIAQALVFRLGRPQVGPDVFQQVEQLPHEFACLFIGDAVQVKVFEHSAACSRGET